MDQQELADRSGISVPTIKRMEAGDGPIRGNYENVAAVVAVIEAAGIDFIQENGGGPGVRLRKRVPAPAEPVSASKPASKASVGARATRKKKGAAEVDATKP